MPALSMMMVINGSRCDPLRNCCHASSFRVSSSYEVIKESRRSKAWCMSSVKIENLKLSGLTGKRIVRKNLLKSIHRGYTPCVTGNCSSVTGLKLGTHFRLALGTANPGVKLKIRNQLGKERSWVKCYAKGVSEGIQKKDSGSQGSGLQQLDSSERNLPSKGGLTGEVRDREGSENSIQPYGPMLGNEISNSEYQKIQDLRFSGDMWEGDSGPQVLDLQRALYWFGYLSKRTELTAYFGPGTKNALQLFQIAYRIPGTGAWGSSSRQALWKILNEESSSFSEGGSGVHNNVQQSGTAFVNNVNARELDAGICVSELVNNMGAHSQEFMSTLSSAPCWRYLPTKVPRNAAIFGLFVGMMATLFGLGYSVVGMLHEQQHGQPVRRRLLRARWRDDLIGTTTTKPRRHVNTFPGIDSPVVGEADYKDRLRPKSRSISTTGTGRTDRLILYEGQVLVGDESPSSVHPFLKGSVSRRGSAKTASQGPYRTKASSIHGQTSIEQANRKPANGESVSVPPGMNFQGSQISSKKTNNLRFRSEHHSMTRVDPDVVGNAVSRTSQNFLHSSYPMEQSNEKQPSIVRGLLSALFTPIGLGNPTEAERPESQRISSSSPQLNASGSDNEGFDNYETGPKVSRSERSSNAGGHAWQGKGEDNLKDGVEALRKSVQAAEMNRQAAVRALADERQRSLELQVKISRQKETAAALEEEVRVLKESHDALLASLRKKYSSSVAARAAAALLYQNWDTDYEEGSPQTISY